MQGQFSFLNLYAPSTLTATGDGTGVDLQGYVNAGGENITARLMVGTVSGTSVTLDVKLQDSSNDSTYADITGATFTQVTAAGSQVIRFRTNKRYVRATHTIAGTSASIPVAGVVLVEPRIA